MFYELLTARKRPHLFASQQIKGSDLTKTKVRIDSIHSSGFLNIFNQRKEIFLGNLQHLENTILSFPIFKIIQ